MTEAIDDGSLKLSRIVPALERASTVGCARFLCQFAEREACKEQFVAEIIPAFARLKRPEALPAIDKLHDRFPHFTNYIPIFSCPHIPDAYYSVSNHQQIELFIVEIYIMCVHIPQPWDQIFSCTINQTVRFQISASVIQNAFDCVAFNHHILSFDDYSIYHIDYIHIGEDDFACFGGLAGYKYR